MRLAAVVIGITLIIIALWDAFETIILARRVSRRLRISRVFYAITWTPWKAASRLGRSNNQREDYLGYYGPLSLIFLLALWAFFMISAFALLQWGAGSGMVAADGHANTLGSHLYVSASTFFTLGIGDVRPTTTSGRFLVVVEAGIGFGFLALVIGFLPGLSSAFSRREVNISLLDSRAGSPPTALELLRRNRSDPAALERLLREWDRWSAELLESHVSFPVLAYFRSQHDNQSWVSSLTCILDTCAIIMAGVECMAGETARLTFAMARHAVVDMAKVLELRQLPPSPDRLPPEAVARLREQLSAAGMPMADGEHVDKRLHELRKMYEPWVNTLAQLLLMPLPPFFPRDKAKDNWQGGS
jgi:Ion channel